MLTVYLYNAPKPSDCFDLSLEKLDELADKALAIFSHHKTATIWLGYLEGWMLTPMDETRLRIVIRMFPCHIVSREPMSFSQAWKNEIDVIHVRETNGSADANNDGGVVQRKRPIEHEPPSGIPPIDGVDHQDRETGCSV